MEVCNLTTGNCVSKAEWLPISELGGKLMTGDLVEMPSRFPKSYPLVGGVVFPLVNHYGVYLEIDGKPMIAHNPFGGRPEIISLDSIEGNRKITRAIRTGLSAEHIIKKVEECQHKKYRFLGENCEDFINYVCGCPIGDDQRVGWALFFIMIILIILAFKK